MIMQSNVAMLSTWYWQSHLHVQLQGITGKDNQTMAMGIRIVFTSKCANFVTQSFMVIDWSRFFKIRMVLATTCAPLSLTLGSNAARGTTVRMLMMARQLWLRCLDLGGVGWEFYEVKLRWRRNNIGRRRWRLRLGRCAWEVNSLLWGSEKRILQGLLKILLTDAIILMFTDITDIW